MVRVHLWRSAIIIKGGTRHSRAHAGLSTCRFPASGKEEKRSDDNANARIGPHRQPTRTLHSYDADSIASPRKAPGSRAGLAAPSFALRGDRTRREYLGSQASRILSTLQTILPG